MLGAKLEPTTGEAPPPTEFSAIVVLAGQLCGVLSLRCNAKSANLMASMMLGIDPKQADEHMWDALGEVCNMIAGNFKNKLTGMGIVLFVAGPAVLGSGGEVCERQGMVVALVARYTRMFPC